MLTWKPEAENLKRDRSDTGHVHELADESRALCKLLEMAILSTHHTVLASSRFTVVRSKVTTQGLFLDDVQKQCEESALWTIALDLVSTLSTFERFLLYHCDCRVF